MYRYHHLHLICSDLERMERFFVEVLGARLVERRKFGTADGAVLDLHGTQINLRTLRTDEMVTGDGSQKHYGYDHLGLEVEDVESAYRALQGEGYQFITPPTDTGTSKMAFFRGPDHIVIELLQKKV
ncbi:MAG: VOC family protein [Syntrophaceae bacterium]|nr:VOC family protein [Syntrophaceae bacterium]